MHILSNICNNWMVSEEKVFKEKLTTDGHQVKAVTHIVTKWAKKNQTNIQKLSGQI